MCMALDISKAEMNESRLHAVTVLTGAAAVMSQVDDVATYSPVAAALAFLLAATSYKDAFSRADRLIDALEDADVIDEDVADVVDEIVDVAEVVADAVDENDE